MLAQGGNAVDAAVAAGFALAVTYPSAGNIGGGGFMVIRLADGKTITNDHREKAPLAASRDMYLDENGDIVEGRSTRTHLAVGVPGTVAGLLDVLERYGTKSRQEVLAPAIRLAREGIMLDADLSASFARRLEAFAPHAASMAIFSKSGEPYEQGDLFRQPDLADALERIAETGKQGFYAGVTAGLLVEEMAANGGLITREDLVGYRSVWREPIVGTYRGYEIVSMPPPSSGGVLLVQMLNMLESLDLQASGFGAPATIHAMIEAERRAYADRAQYLGDPDFYPVPVERLISKSYAAERFADFDPQQASRSEDIGAGVIPLPESPDTTHLSVIDGQGNAVAYTTTLNLSYGSKIVAAGTGILLNNEMDDFSAKENAPNFYGLLGRAANAIEPGKRMLSSMTPTIVVRDDKPVLVTGSPGGSTIITTTMQVIINVLDHGMGVADAVASPRFHHQWMPDRVMHEAAAVNPAAAVQLEALGHANLAPVPAFLGGGIGDANSVMWTPQGITGAADPRNAGTAVAASQVK
ncbi:MAG: gamma-glutamyltransferase, partial [Pseudomonadota bacterium]